MGFKISYSSSLAPTLILLAVAAASISHAAHEALPAEAYWQKVLPTTPMPRSIKNLLRPAELTQVYGDDSNVARRSSIIRYYAAAAAAASVYRATQSIPTADSPNLAGLFFLENDLVPGSMKNLEFITTSYSAAFLPRKAAESIPFSSDKLPEVLVKFSVAPNSDFTDAVKRTLENCEAPVAEGEIKRCATSLESMVDFSVSTLGTSDLRAVTTEVPEKMDLGSEKQSSVAAVTRVQKLRSSKLVACHLQPYPYAVFHCHKPGLSRLYNVALTTRDGTVVDAVAVCHVDTSKWNPDDVAFKLVKVKPGTVPICHFLSQKNIIWTRRV